MRAKLRVCASCEWVFKSDIVTADLATAMPIHGGCPKCGFGHYGAKYVYGNKAYSYAVSQKPWLEKKMLAYELKLLEEIAKSTTQRETYNSIESADG